MNALVIMMETKTICRIDLPTISRLFMVVVPGVGESSNLHLLCGATTMTSGGGSRRGLHPGGGGEAGGGCHVHTAVIVPAGQ